MRKWRRREGEKTLSCSLPYLRPRSSTRLVAGAQWIPGPMLWVDEWREKFRTSPRWSHTDEIPNQVAWLQSGCQAYETQVWSPPGTAACKSVPSAPHLSLSHSRLASYLGSPHRHPPLSPSKLQAVCRPVHVSELPLDLHPCVWWIFIKDVIVSRAVTSKQTLLLPLRLHWCLPFA